MLKQDSHLYEFGPFRLDTSERLLLRGGVRVPLAEKAFDTLAALVRREGRLATKEELMAEVWPDAFVEENNLDKSISAVRQALGERASAPRYVETVRGRGYRFVARVSEVRDREAGLADEGYSQAQSVGVELRGSTPAANGAGTRQAVEDTAPPVAVLCQNSTCWEMLILREDPMRLPWPCSASSNRSPRAYAPPSGTGATWRWRTSRFASKSPS